MPQIHYDSDSFAAKWRYGVYGKEGNSRKISGNPQYFMGCSNGMPIIIRFPFGLPVSSNLSRHSPAFRPYPPFAQASRPPMPPSLFLSFGVSSKSRLFVRRKRGAVCQSSGHCFCKHRKNVHFCRLQGMPLTPMPPAGGRLPRRCRKKQCRSRAFRPATPCGVFLIIALPILLRKEKIKREGENAIRITWNYPILSRDNLVAVFFVCKSADNGHNTQKFAL